MFKKIAAYLKDVQVEMGKVSWPARDELKESTLIVIAVSLVLAVYIFTLDTGLSTALKLIL